MCVYIYIERERDRYIWGACTKPSEGFGMKSPEAVAFAPPADYIV